MNDWVWLLWRPGMRMKPCVSISPSPVFRCVFNQLNKNINERKINKQKSHLCALWCDKKDVYTLVGAVLTRVDRLATKWNKAFWYWFTRHTVVYVTGIVSSIYTDLLRIPGGVGQRKTPGETLCRKSHLKKVWDVTKVTLVNVLNAMVFYGGLSRGKAAN